MLTGKKNCARGNESNFFKYWNYQAQKNQCTSAPNNFFFLAENAVSIYRASKHVCIRDKKKLIFSSWALG
jgi:hypothetical protein